MIGTLDADHRQEHPRHVANCDESFPGLSRLFPIMSTVSPQPSVDDLLDRLQDEHERLSALRAGVVHGVPRPPLLIWLLLLVSVLLITVLTALIGLVGLRTVDLTVAIREHRQARTAAQTTLPSGASLLDTAAMNEAVARHPEAVSRLYALRGEALLQQGKTQAAADSLREARLRAFAPLPSAFLILELKALLASGRRDEVRQRLLAIDLSGWSESDRSAALGLLPLVLEADVSR